MTSPSPPCPFCTIASTNPPMSINDAQRGSQNVTAKDNNATTAHLILSTEHILAFLDIMPLARGHVLVAPRRHFEMLGDLGVEVAGEMGKWLPVLSRVVTKTVFGDEGDRHWNVVQNNGTRAAQQVPHVHFHIIPRPATDGAHKPSFVMFGRGQRDELDDDEGASLARAMRLELANDVKRVQRDEGVDLTQSPRVVSDAKQRGKL